MRTITVIISIFILFIFGCGTGYEVQWKEIGNEVIIQTDNINPDVSMYYAEITLESGCKIAVQLGTPDAEGKFLAKNTFGNFSHISVYSDSDLKEGESPGSQNSIHNLYPDTREAAIVNLLNGLNSDNYGLRTSSAYMLGEIKANEAVIPLMKMLRTENNEEARIVAALALYKINDSRGVFAVKRAIRFDNSDRVKKMCSNFYNQILRERYLSDEYGFDGTEQLSKR